MKHRSIARSFGIGNEPLRVDSCDDTPAEEDIRAGVEPLFVQTEDGPRV